MDVGSYYLYREKGVIWMVEVCVCGKCYVKNFDAQLCCGECYDGWCCMRNYSWMPLTEGEFWRCLNHEDSEVGFGVFVDRCMKTVDTGSGYVVVLCCELLLGL